MIEKSKIEDVLKDNINLIKLINFNSAYPGNIKSNISIYETIKKMYSLDIDKKTFMGYVKLYLNEGNIDKAYCSVCGKPCNVKTDYSFHNTCSKECGHIVSNEKIKLINSIRTEEEKKAIQKKREETMMKKYGVSNSLQLESTKEHLKEKYGPSMSCFSDPEVRKRINEKNALLHGGKSNPFQWISTKEKIINTCIEKYGVDNPAKNDSVKEKTKKTQEERYGGYGFASEEVNKKIKQTNLERYGKECPQSNEDIKEKVAKTNVERYGKRAPMQVDSVRKKSIQTSLERYGVEWNCMSDQCKTQAGIISQINLYWKDLIEKECGYTVTTEKSFGRYSFDLCIESRKLLIEINPTLTHQSTHEVKTHFGVIPPKDKNYHTEKLKVAHNNGYDCIMIWDWDDEYKLLSLISDKLEVRLNKCILTKIDINEANRFLNKHHLQGACRGQTIAYGLLDNEGKLISVMTFGKSRYNKKYEYEWLRYASIKKVHRAVSTMYNKFLEDYKPKSVISYCDRSKFNGVMFKNLGFVLDKEPEPSLHFYNRKTEKYFTANQVRGIGACRCLNIPQIDYKTTGKDNTSIMIENGFEEVYDCGQASYTWHAKE